MGNGCVWTSSVDSAPYLGDWCCHQVWAWEEEASTFMGPTGCLTLGFIGPGRRGMSCPHFTDEDNKAQKGPETCSRSLRCRPCLCLRCGTLGLGLWPEEPPNLTLPQASSSTWRVSFPHNLNTHCHWMEWGLNEGVDVMSSAQGSVHRYCSQMLFLLL